MGRVTLEAEKKNINAFSMKFTMIRSLDRVCVSYDFQSDALTFGGLFLMIHIWNVDIVSSLYIHHFPSFTPKGPILYMYFPFIPWRSISLSLSNWVELGGKTKHGISLWCFDEISRRIWSWRRLPLDISYNITTPLEVILYLCYLRHCSSPQFFSFVFSIRLPYKLFHTSASKGRLSIYCI